MWLKLNLDGIIMSLQIKGYRKTNKDNWCETWCTTEFYLISEPWLNFAAGGEILLASEVDNLAEMLDALLHDRIDKPEELPCIEPDFNFVLNPKRDLRLDGRYTYVRPGCEIEDINMEWKVSFWNGGPTANYISVMLDRPDLENLLLYLKVVTGVIKPDAPEVAECVKKNIIYWQRKGGHMLNLVQGCKVSNPAALSEQYQIVDNGFSANVNAENIEAVFQHFIVMQDALLFFILELPAHADVEDKLRITDSDPMHKDIYYIDGLSCDEALTLMIRYGALLINDGISRFGFGVQDNSAELMLDKYNIVTLWTEQAEKYQDFFGLHNIPQVEECLTAWDTFSESTPGECTLIETDGKTVYDLVQELSQWGIYMAERRIDK